MIVTVHKMNQPEPISVKTINWSYLSQEPNPSRIEYIDVFEKSKKIRLTGYIGKFCQLMVDHPDKIYPNNKKHTVKIYVKFKKNSIFNEQYERDKYDSKESTFYIDDSLLPQIESIEDPS
ncbi:hypothetical protein HPT25_26980 [Bacillus sp. BRMEA1]|uniref:hypothetical protein n=1 Tax=Neobacillus endophyticus TaxID=2738405 RepID=UPI0015676837|nr:hypothetical protein [Neobacillus endophyticus]NRD80971.1 hypothetical protein [Neobacillus endophyticus]